MTLVELVPDGQLFLDALACVLIVIICVVSHSQLVIEISDILADLRANDLLLHRDSFHDELQSA